MTMVIWIKYFEVTLIRLANKCGSGLDKEPSNGWIVVLFTEMAGDQ